MITLAGILAVLGTISLVATQNDKVVDVYKKYLGEKPATSDSKTEGKKIPTEISPEACHSLRVKTFPVFPYYLVNSYSNNPDRGYMYWALISGKSECNRDLVVKVKFRPERFARVMRKEIDTTIECSPEVKIRKDPVVKIDARTEENFDIKGDWEILTASNKRTLAKDDFTIQVIAKDRVYWDLKNPDGKLADFDFLLASLSAWSILPKKPKAELKDLAVAYLEQGSDPDQWLNNCYTNLFRSSRAVQVSRLPGSWPLEREKLNSIQEIRTWETILKEKKADSLEAALLVAALKNAVAKDLKFHLVLFALPADPGKAAGDKRFLLAWPSRGSECRAIDLTQPNTTDFDLNVQQASATLAQALETKRSGFSSMLDKKGVFYDDQEPRGRQTLLALDFATAPGYYYISGLKDA